VNSPEKMLSSSDGGISQIRNNVRIHLMISEENKKHISTQKITRIYELNVGRLVREGTFFIGGGGDGGGCFRNFLGKKSWPSHLPEWINA